MKEVANSLSTSSSTTVNADQEWEPTFRPSAPSGTLCFVGVPPSPVCVHAFPLISGQRTISGNPTGQPLSRLREMLDVAARRCRRQGRSTEPFPMAKAANEAIEKVKKGRKPATAPSPHQLESEISSATKKVVRQPRTLFRSLDELGDAHLGGSRGP